MTTLDPITLEVLWNRILSVANEQQVALMRTAFSTIVRESQDLACGVFDTRGQMIAQSLTGTPGHINPMATGVRHLLAAYPPATLAPGDVLITNDPWQTSGQLNDFTVLTPVFAGERIVGYFGNLCHAADIGGRVLSADAHEVYEEGIRIPITKLFLRGEPNQELIRILRANVRTPDETIGDLYAQASCNAVGARSLLQMMQEFGLESIDPLSDAIIARSEAALRAAIRNLPNGTYRHEVWSDGFEEPLRICATVTIRDEDIDIDFTGSSPQSRRGINVVLNYTHGYASFAIKAAISPEVPHNEGSFRPIHVSAPSRSILNCEPPAAVAARHLVGHFLPSAIFGALSHIIPERIIAGGADPIWLSVWRGSNSDGSNPFLLSTFQVGGMGARPSKDGLHTTGFPSGVAGIPAEVAETLAPLIQQRRELRCDSGGAGAFRGGLGQASTWSRRGNGTWNVSAMIDRTLFAAQGHAGGQAGALGEFQTADGTRLPPKTVVWFEPDTAVQLNLPGGAGYGDPLSRDPASVLLDVVEGYVSLTSAEQDYGVIIRYLGNPEQLVRLPKHYSIDWEATNKCRATSQG
jgi:N-methylhydantoinase B